TITHFGGQVTFLALPLTAAIMLDASPFEVGVLTALEALPYPLFGLFAGVLVDRARKLPVIIWADIGRGVALLAVPVCAWLGVLSMPVLYVVGFLVGLGSVVGWPAYQVFMTERVGRDHLVEANAKIAVSDSASQLVGPGLAGALIQWLTAPIAILLDALSFMVSAWMLRGIPPAATDAPKISGESVWREIGEGLAVVWRNKTLRALAWSLSAWQLFRHAYVAVVILFAARELGFSAGHVGLLFMLAGVGSLVAAGAVTPLNARFGFGPTMLAALGGTGVAWLVLGASTGGFVVASLTFGLGLFLLDFAAMTFFINYLTLRQTVTPDRLLGRVTATMICLTVATAPLGGLAGGWVAEHWGLRAAILLAGAGALAMIPLVAWTSPLAKMRTLPGPQEVSAPDSVAEEMAG
ncbi:MAG TPA: MFS transporter, partial [Usitatibacteraceae bacterium]|nr:MFS transporter [Usitatibacteraceae bacterium]